MKVLHLTKGKTALVDDVDYEYLHQFKWNTFECKGITYARRSTFKDGKNGVVLMHRDIMKPDFNLVVDHIDHNGLNNIRSNLRVCSRSENMKNKKPCGKSKYLGVSPYIKKFPQKDGSIKEVVYYLSNIRVCGDKIHIGNFNNEAEAAKAFDEAAKKYHGDFANLNFK